MAEIVNTVLLSHPTNSMPMSRAAFYKEQIAAAKAGGPTRSVEVIQALLFTAQGDLILQSRSREKAHNPGMIDKSLGGHIRFGDTPGFTVMAEALQELLVPASVLAAPDEFMRAFGLLKRFLATMALVQYVDGPCSRISKKLIGGENVKIANTYHLYLGLFGGPIMPADREASGILYYGYPNVLEEINNEPHKFTDDLRFFLLNYAEKIHEFLKVLR